MPQLSGFITACVVVGVLWGSYALTRDFFKPPQPEILSSDLLIKKVKWGIHDVIPADAYDIQCVWYGRFHCKYWCAFSVGEDGLKKIEAKYASQFAADTDKPLPVSHAVPQPFERYRPLLGWPNDKGNLKTVYLERGWIGINPVNHRVYHFYST